MRGYLIPFMAARSCSSLGTEAVRRKTSTFGIAEDVHRQLVIPEWARTTPDAVGSCWSAWNADLTETRRDVSSNRNKAVFVGSP